MILTHSLTPVNILRGIVPTASIWDTAPTNLANATDGDFATVTGTGSKAMSGAGTFGYITVDIGSVKTVLIGARIGIWSTAGNIYVNIDSSDDGVTYRAYPNSIALRSSTSELIIDIISSIVNGRYIRFQFYTNAVCTANAKLYEIMGWEMRV